MEIQVHRVCVYAPYVIYLNKIRGFNFLSKRAACMFRGVATELIHMCVEGFWLHR